MLSRYRKLADWAWWGDRTMMLNCFDCIDPLAALVIVWDPCRKLTGLIDIPFSASPDLATAIREALFLYAPQWSE